MSKFGSNIIHNTDNVVNLPHGKNTLHQKITNYYNSKQLFTGDKRVREWISSQSYQEQYDFGMKVMNKFIKQGYSK